MRLPSAFCCLLLACGPVLPVAAAPDYEQQLQAIEERLRQMEADRQAGSAGGEFGQSERPPEPPPIVLQDWHRNLSNPQLRLLVGTIQPAPFEPDAAPDPDECLTAFRTAVREADSFVEVVPFLSLPRRQQYLLSEGHPDYARYRRDDGDWLAYYRKLLVPIVRIQATLENPDQPGRVQLIVWTHEPATELGPAVYRQLRLEMRGEGKLWRLVGYKAERRQTTRPALLDDAVAEPNVGPELPGLDDLGGNIAD